MQSCLNISAHKMSTSESSKFCAGELWNNNLTWYTDSPDFPTCFHKTILVYVPCAVLWLLSPIELKSNFSSNKRFVPWTFLNISKIPEDPGSIPVIGKFYWRSLLITICRNDEDNQKEAGKVLFLKKSRLARVLIYICSRMGLIMTL